MQVGQCLVNLTFGLLRQSSVWGILKHLENKLYLIIVLLRHPTVVCRPRRLQGARAEAGDQLGGS